MTRSVFNVLVLGQSGVGKSTLINSIANYFTFGSFKDALGQQPVCVIPASFEIMDSDYNYYKVEVGTPNDNENLQDLADSCTQKPKVYSFRHKDLNINFIDVPGIGDTRGVDTDNTNIKSILDTVALFDQIHAICILLKSTDTKLTVEYQYCLNELLMHLHQKAIPNVVFVFTCSQASNFVPANGRMVLAAYLKQLQKDKGIEIPLSKEHMFCIDNDAFRFLCAYHQIDAFKSEKPDPYVDSWNRSQCAVISLFARMKTLVPHDVVHTLSVNQARAVILSLIQPLAAISSLIQSNAANYETNFDDLVRRLQE
uniref:G domain-containing protein n=1 Tax=Panagrolaimus sp. JU765 TaxID=591449 RepID=A0AC34R1V6_9BILA